MGELWSLCLQETQVLYSPKGTPSETTGGGRFRGAFHGFSFCSMFYVPLTSQRRCCSSLCCRGPPSMRHICFSTLASASSAQSLVVAGDKVSVGIMSGRWLQAPKQDIRQRG